MASFVEQAVLMAADKSTPQINLITKALKELFRPAKQLTATPISPFVCIISTTRRSRPCQYL
jgi:hypothetical protein